MTTTTKITSPIDGSIYAERAIAGDAAIDAAVRAAKAAQKDWRQVAISERGKIALAFLDALAADGDRIVTELAWQMGRPVRYRGEQGGVDERVRHMISIAETALAPHEPAPIDGLRRYIAREPVGLVFVIAPWNYPYLTALNSVVPALVAGNAVLLKHASQTLLVGERIADAFKAAGLPDGLFHNLVLSHDQTERLIGSGSADHISFTGSVSGGKSIERAAAGTFASLGLELGGKDPAYVRADADLGHTVENLVDGAFFNSGQSCCGIERIYVDTPLYDEFIAGFAEHTNRHIVGNPLDADTTLGPMAHARFADAVREQTAEALRKGARSLSTVTAENDRPGSPYLAPHALVDVDHQMSIMREESFGPVVGIMKVRGDDEAIALMNDSPYGLSASVWTRDLERAAELGAQIETGTVFANRCDYLDPALVWTGVKDTGRGAALSKYGYDALTQAKSFHLRAI
ncbi:MAG: aldehyde dehydrogenase family protein [Alphaproteobacteria bacterium]